MAVGDVNYCLADLAEMLGMSAYTGLPTVEQAKVLALFNEAYRECYLTPDGKRPRWATQPVSYLAKAPVTLTATLTNGMKTIGSPSTALEAAYAGSMMRIGTKFYTYAGKDTNDYMVEPWDGETGTQSITFYFSSYVLPVTAIDLVEEPELVGVGRLVPLNGRSQEIRSRSYTVSDFAASLAAGGWWGGWGWSFFGPLGGDYETGTPVAYFIDSASLSPNDVFATRLRFNVYPLPDGSAARTVRAWANIVPASLTVGGDLPKLPADAITDILLPIARMKVAMGMRRYNGTNKADLIALGNAALAKLDTLASPQQAGKIPLQVKPGW